MPDRVSLHTHLGVYAMALNLLPLGALGAVESNGAVTFGVWLPWVSSADGDYQQTVVNTLVFVATNAKNTPI